MLIVNQDKNIIFEAKELSLFENYITRGYKGSLEIIASYDNEEKAKDEFDLIIKAIQLDSPIYDLSGQEV